MPHQFLNETKHFCLHPIDGVNEAKRPMMDATNGVVSHSQQLQQIIAPEGSSISTTAGGQKVITTPDGKQMIVKVAANGQQMVVGTIDPVRYGWNLKIYK